MSKTVTIAIDAMGGDDSPEKVIKGVSHHSKNSENINYNIFGDRNLVEPIIKNHKITHNFELFHTNKKISNDDTALMAAKKGSETSMWLAIDSVKEKNLLEILVHCL